MVHKSFFEDDAPSEPIPTSAAPDLPFPLNGTSTSAAPSKKQRLQPITTTISSSNPAPNGLDNKSKKAKQQQQQQSNSRNPHDKSKAKVVSYHESDEEEERHEGLQLPYNPSGANGDGNGGKKRKQADGEGGQGERARERQQLQAEKERLKEQRMELPIWSGQQSIVKAVEENDTVVILGETGSGKTTQVPQFLLSLPSLNSQRIAITQPRKVAATSLASRVAAEQGTTVGMRVGHSVRFDTKVSPSTRLVYATDGMLVRELLGDGELSKYGCVIVDEAHERNIATDVLLGSLKRIQRTRNSAGSTNPLKVIIMSATLNANLFSDFFNKCPILYVRGRQHPVKIYNTLSLPEDYQEAAIRTFFQIHEARPSGDVLIFLTGQEDIDNLTQQISSIAKQIPHTKQQVLVCPFMASTTPSAQAKVFSPAPANTRKVILATNVAETSITIPGIKYVIDSGYCKEKNYINRKGTGIETLSLTRISQSAAQQRTGRAGREGPGFCYRLYPTRAYDEMTPSPLPEIMRSNLTEVVLQLKEFGIEKPEEFDFLDSPDPAFILESVLELVTLGALRPRPNSSIFDITPLGRRMLLYPLPPAQSACILASLSHSCTSDILDILALSSESPIFTDPHSQRDEALAARQPFIHRDGDHLTNLNVLRSYESVPREEGGGMGRKIWCRERFVNERNLKRAIESRDQMREIVERDVARSGIPKLMRGSLVGEPVATEDEEDGVDGDEDEEAKKAKGREAWKKSAGDDSEPILRSLVEGLFAKTAIFNHGEYRQMLGNSAVKIHPSSTLHSKRSPVILYDEIVHTTSTYARTVSRIEYSWLAELPVFQQRTAAEP